MTADTSKHPEALGGKSGDHEQEIAKYEVMLAQDPKSRAFALLAEAYRKSGRFDDAMKTARDGLKHYPYYLSGRVALARAYLDGGQGEPAREEFEKVISAAPDNLMAHRYLAEIYLAEGKRIEAAKSLRMVVLLDPRDAKAREQLNNINPEPKAAAPAAHDDFGMLLDSHRYESAPPPPEAQKSIPTLTDQEIIHQPELSVRTEPPQTPVEVGMDEADESSFGDIEFPDFVEEPVFEPQGGPRFVEAVPPPPKPAPEPVPPPVPIPAPAAASPPLPPPSVPVTAPASAEAALWDEIMEDVIPSEEPPDELNTETLAEIYIQQGFYDKALGIYEKMLPGQPRNVRILQKIEELKSLVKMAGRPAWGGESAVVAPPRPQTAPPAAPAVPPRSETMAGKAALGRGRLAGDQEALQILRQWMDRLKTEKR